MRHAERGVAAARALQQVERAVVAPLEESEAPHAGLDLGLRDGEAGAARAPQGQFVELFGGAEVVAEGVEVCERVLDDGELLEVARGEEARARELEVVLGLAVAVAPPAEVSDVVLDAARGRLVAVFEEDVARAQARLDGLVVAAEHGERDELADLRLGGRVWEAESAEARVGLVEVRDRLLHLPADERGDALGPRA